ncbi:hypothetical protein Q8A73_009236 [Channa argus]|nr:hypothetical protein Q8A73_009236 [Channa argus]
MLAGHYGLLASWREVLALISRSTALSIHRSILENFNLLLNAQTAPAKLMCLSCSLTKDKLWVTRHKLTKPSQTRVFYGYSVPECTWIGLGISKVSILPPSACWGKASSSV